MTDTEPIIKRPRPEWPRTHVLRIRHRQHGLIWWPELGAEHDTSPGCPCRPYVDYTDPVTGFELWVHRALDC